MYYWLNMENQSFGEAMQDKIESLVKLPKGKGKGKGKGAL